ncbi:MAG TPA: hypothetical protein VNQ77_08785 [Frankiaceae bacterium]|nr:hypothetical protein [Frankiaceae bacterium]
MTIARALRALLLAVVFACALPVSGAYACSCAVEPGGVAPLEGTVFYGEIVRRDVEGQGATYVVDVERVYAGSVGTRAEVRTPAHGASCGLEIPGSGGALFYAEEKNGLLTSHLCTGTRSADGPPAHLGEGYPPTGAGAVATSEPAAAPPSGDGGGSGSRALPVAAAFVAVAACAVLVLRTKRPALTQPSPGPAA